MISTALFALGRFFFENLIHGGKSAAVQAFLAGNDLLLSSDCRNDYQALYDAVESGEVPMATLKEAVVRVLAAKYALGIV